MESEFLHWLKMFFYPSEREQNIAKVKAYIQQLQREAFEAGRDRYVVNDRTILTHEMMPKFFTFEDWQASKGDENGK